MWPDDPTGPRADDPNDIHPLARAVERAETTEWYLLSMSPIELPSPRSLAVLGRVVALAGVAAAALAVVVMILLGQARAHERALHEQQGHQRIDREHDFLSREVHAVQADVLYLAEQETLHRFLSGERDVRSQLEREYANFARRRGVYDQIRCLDGSGREIVRVDFRGEEVRVIPPEELQHKAGRYYVRESQKLGPGEVFVSRFDLNVERGEIQRPLEPVVRFVTPAVDRAGQTRGLLALNYSGKHLLGRLGEVSLPGSTLLIDARGEYIHGPEEQDAWGWMLGHDRTFPAQFPEAWEKIRDERSGQFAGERGLFTFRRVSLSGSRGGGPLLLVARVPEDALFARSNELLRQLLLLYAGAMVLIVTLGWYWAWSAVVRARQAQSIVASEARLRALSSQLLTVQETERRRISRELHDELGQQVTAISLDLQLAARQEDSARARELLQHAVRETEHLLQSLHEIASRVRPPVLDDLGLRDALESLAEEFSRRAGLRVGLSLSFDERRLSTRIRENIYRVVHEGLANAAKHAETQDASVIIEDMNDAVHVRIEDEGVGFDPERADRSRLGLLGMRERVELLGGAFRLDSSPGRGTRITATIGTAAERT